MARRELKRGLGTVADQALGLLAGPWGRLRGRPSRGDISDPREVLFVRPDHLGDFLLSLPAMALAREAWPGAHIVALVGSWAAPLARLAEPIDEALVHDLPWWSEVRGRPGGRLAWALEVRSLLRDLRRRSLDVAIDFRGDLRHILLFLWQTRSRARVALTRTGGVALLTHALPWDPGAYWGDQGVRLLEEAGLRGPPPPGPYLREDPAAAARVEEVLASAGLEEASLAVVHPGARQSIRAWPAARFAPVLDHLEAAGLRVVLVGGTEDAQRARQISRLARVPPLDLCGRSPLPFLVSLLRRSRLFVGNDSGLSHLAAACQVPRLVLFGPSDPRQYMTPGGRDRVVRRPLPCSPCLHDRCPYSAEPAGQCLVELPPADVIAALDSLLVEIDLKGSSRF